MAFITYTTKPENYYVYDANCNSVLRIKKEHYEALSMKNGKDAYQVSVEDFQKKGFLMSSGIKKIEYPAINMLKYQLGSCINSITFQMTQNCNLRCSYCPYSNDQIYKQRHHNTGMISWEIIKKGIDFLKEHSKDAETIYVAFYGGEPLLNKKLIIDAMDYTMLNIKEKKISFGMTTNATLLNDAILSELDKYDISIMVSLDGGRKEHNQNRKFANGEGSFDIVERNVRNIKENYPKLFSKLKFNTVIAPGSNYSSIWDFFKDENNIFDFNKVNFNTLSRNYTDEDIQYDAAFFEERNYETLKAYLMLLGKLDKQNISEHKSDIEHIFSFKEMFIPRKEVPEIAHPSGTCIPGVKKLFVDIYGNFYPCERVDENSDIMRIGNLENGFDIERVTRLLSIGTTTEEICKECWAFNCCTICPASADDGKSLEYSADFKLKKCHGVKENALENIKDYTMLKEFGFEFRMEELLK